jgi:hypothetical protein
MRAYGRTQMSEAKQGEAESSPLETLVRGVETKRNVINTDELYHEGRLVISICNTDRSVCRVGAEL